MTNEATYKILDLPHFLESHYIYKTDWPRHFGVRWADSLIRYFNSETAANSVVWPVDIYIESVRYSGELEVFRDGSHAIRMAH